MERSFEFFKGEYYHVFNRGVEKREIFKEEADWDRFQSLMYLCNSRKPLVFKLIQGDPLEWDRGETVSSILAYALMPNHFHMIVREDEPGGISKLLSKMATSYSMYFNTKYERSGPLLCRPFRARHISDDDYFRWAMSYVHLNPLHRVSGSIDILRTNKYCSYQDYYVGERNLTRLLNMGSLPIDPHELETEDEMRLYINSLQGVPLE